MSDYKALDSSADVLPVGLQPTPFGEVWQALQQVAASVWNVAPSVYRAGMAWLWYAINHPDDLASDSLRALLVAALISEQAPMVKDWQTNAELVEYLRVWRTYSPTYAKLEAIFATFGARVEVRPVSDAESQGVVPVSDRRLAFYLRVEEFDAARPLTLDEVYQIAVRATPLGSRPVPYFALVGSSDVFAGPASAGLVRALWASEPAELVTPSFVVVDSTTGKIVSGCNQELTTYELPSVILNSEDGYETYELPSISLAVPRMVIGVPISGPVQSFWFTDNGQAETVDTELVIRNGLRDAEGVKVKSLDSTDYQGANVLAYMEADGDMFTSSEASFTWFGSDSLRQLFVDNQDARGKSAWSVFAAKLFHLSFVNTQLPDVTIELPAAVVDTYGTSITLPTIDGGYESGGKTWKPSAWDIGAFGSSYSLTADTVAHLVFEEVQQYTEITLYMQSGSKQAQKQVTSGFTGNVNATYCYQLYTDEQLTTPWTGYDYSNTYEFGSWNDGVWVPFATQKVSNLPDTYTSDSTQWKMAFILMDDGFLWLASNVSGSGYMSYPSGFIRVHIYPKGETVFAMYPVKTSSMGIYDNKSISTGGQNMQWVRGTSGSTQGGVNFPIMLVNGVYKSGAIFDQSLVSRAKVWSSGGNDSTILASSTSSFSCNAITFTFEQPIYKAWFKPDHTDKKNSSLGYLPTNTNHTLYDESGDTIDFEDDCTYTPCLVFIADGSANGDMYINASQSLVSNNSNKLAYKYTNGTLSRACYVLYTKKYGIDIDVNFGDPVTVPEGYRVESVKCSKLFVKASNVTGDDATREINFEYLGENLFCTDKNKTWFGAKVSPVIEMFGFSNPSTFGGFRLSCYTTYNGYADSVSASEFNSGGYFVKGSAVLASSYTASTYVGYMQTSPMMFRLYSGGNVLAEYHFTIQNSMWSFQNGIFSWVGDDTDYSDLAYWYKSAPGVRVHCVKI